MSTPGQIVYAVWWRTRYGLEQADAISAYQMLPAVDRQAWEAAAQAVLDYVDFPPRDLPVEEEPS